MKSIKKLFILVLVFFGLMLIAGCVEPPVKPTISLEKDSIEIFVDEIYTIEVKSENLENPQFEYALQEGNEYLQLAGNMIKGLKAGQAVVLIGVKDNLEVEKITLNVKVKNIVPEKINTIDDINIKLGETFDIEYTFEPENAIAGVVFKSLDESVATVDANGKVTSKKAGTTKIEITLDVEGNTLKKEISVLVRGTDLPKVEFADTYKDNITVNWGAEFNYKEGITVTDVEEGDITDKLVLSKPLDVKEYGKQVIEYSVSDSDGNTSTFERTVNVVWNYDVQFIGHAGSYFGVMNSEEAILYAITELKYQLVEVDIKQTKDGVFVLCHDDDFAGYTLSSYTWDQLKDIERTSTRKDGFAKPDVKGDGKYTSKLCTLERFLEICKQYNVKAVIELKSSNGITNSNQSRMQALMDEIEKADMLDGVVFLGSQYNCLIWTRNNGYDYIPCQYLVNSIESETYLQRCIDYNLDISCNTTANYSNSDEWIARYHEAGLKVSTYTYTQYVDYSTVQEWINKGVDFVTCDWHQMDKLKLPVSSNEPVEKVTVKFVDEDGTVLKERQINKGATAAAPTMKDKEGYEFIGWDKDLKNIQEDTVFTAQYNLVEYTITYNANVDVITEGKWANKDEFVTEFYNDLFEWIKSKGTTLDGLKINGTEYSFTRNGKTVKFSSAADIKALNVYDFELTMSNIMYKQVERASDGTCVIYPDENFFLNSDKYRVKYQGMDQWLYNCAKTAYSSYDTSYKVLSSGKIQIFFRMHQWMNGTNIPAFNAYPTKYIVEADSKVNPTLPTDPVKYTIKDEITLKDATGSVKFLGWYLTADCSGEKVTSIPKGTTGNIVLYVKWDK